MLFLRVVDVKLYIQTSNKKEVYVYMLINPNIEICVFGIKILGVP